MTAAVKKILIIGPSWVGDMVMAQSLFIVLKQRHPDCLIDVLAPAWSLPILERMPQIRNGIEMPIGHGRLALGERMELGRRLSRNSYQQAIVLPNSFKSALIPLFADIPLRTGWRGEMRYFLLNDIRLLIKRRYPLMVQRFVALAYDSDLVFDASQLQLNNLPYPSLRIDAQQVESLYERFPLQKNLPLLALCPGAEFGSSKRWPETNFAQVAAMFIHRGWQVALMGSANDRGVADAIEQQLPTLDRKKCSNLAGETSLSEAIDLLSQAGAVVSNDSGLMHIAAALHRPLVVVYGSTSPAFTPPLSHNVSVQSVAVDCGPCFKRECPLSEKQGRLTCLKQLTADTVINALDELL